MVVRLDGLELEVDELARVQYALAGLGAGGCPRGGDDGAGFRLCRVERGRGFPFELVQLVLGLGDGLRGLLVEVVVSARRDDSDTELVLSSSGAIYASVMVEALEMRVGSRSPRQWRD